MTDGSSRGGDRAGAVGRGRGASRAEPTVGIACALAEELEAVERLLASRRHRALGPVEAVAGDLDAHRVLLALTGVGKVDAALAASVLCARGGVRALLALGVAGSLDADVGPGDIVVGTRLVQHDFGTATDGGIVMYRAGQLPLPGTPPEPEPSIPAALERDARAALAGLRPVRPGGVGATADDDARTPAVTFGTIATGDVFVAGDTVRSAIRARTGAVAVEMEGAAVARVGARFGVPVLVVRAISDRAGATSPVDFADLLPAAAAAAAEVARRLVPVLLAHGSAR